MVETLVRPRVCWVPDAPGSLGVGCGGVCSAGWAWCLTRSRSLCLPARLVFARMVGGRRVRWGSMCRGRTGRARFCLARELFGLFELGERLLIHTAHEFKTSAEHFNRLETVIRECPELHRPGEAEPVLGGLWGTGIRMVRSRSSCRMVGGSSSRRGRSRVCVVSPAWTFWGWTRR